MSHQHAPLTHTGSVVYPSSGGRMECGVCWYVYDPDLGDDEWQIKAGTAFGDLPDHWQCPNCDAVKSKFLVLDSEFDGAEETRTGDVEALIKAYKKVDQERMQDLPFRNQQLGVEAVGFQPWQSGSLGVVITPWFMNLVYLAGEDTDWSAHRHGDLVIHVLPSGRYEFIQGDLDGFGVLQSCSLSSPVLEFETMESARETASAVMLLMLEAPKDDVAFQGEPLKTEPDPEPTLATGRISRRELIRGRRAAAPQTDL